MKVWKLLGLAGLAGVTATGVIIARSERRRAHLTPGEIRARLHERYAATATVANATSNPEPGFFVGDHDTPLSLARDAFG